jgi:hypothetical protein
MSIPKKSIRGLQNIRSRSGMADQVSEPYRAYLRIGSLEMEKARRSKERESAMLRVNGIDERFRQIDAEKAELLKVLNLGNPMGIDVPAGEKKSGFDHNRTPGGFRINY